MNYRTSLDGASMPGGAAIPFPPSPQALPSILWDRDGQVFTTLFKIKESLPYGKDISCRTPSALLKFSEICGICPPLCSYAPSTGQHPAHLCAQLALCHQEFCFPSESWVGICAVTENLSPRERIPKGCFVLPETWHRSQVQSKLNWVHNRCQENKEKQQQWPGL